MPRINRRIIPQTGPYILTRRSVNPSARILARELGLQKAYEPRNYPPVIRWGNSEGSYQTGDTVHNRREIIYIVSNKLRFSTAMANLGIPHVEILRGVPERFPVVVRHNLSGSRGIGIQIVTDKNQVGSVEELPEEIFPYLYWSYWRNFSTELGVHIFDGKIVKVFKKVWEGDTEENSDEEEFPIRNASKGYGFRLVKLDKYPKLIPLIQNFCDKFGMSFGRIDVGWDKDIKQWIIIEANSAPSIAENANTAEMYINGFKKLLGKE